MVSILPNLFDNFVKYGIVGRALKEKLCFLNLYNPRNFIEDGGDYKQVDDKSYGGGPMLMKVEPLENTVKHIVSSYNSKSSIVKIFLTPKGRLLNNDLVNIILQYSHCIMVCGRYEGIDERFISRNVDLEISIGDFVLSGGELPAMLLMESVIRKLPNVLNNINSVTEDSFENGLLDYPHYTKPDSYDGMHVPDVLLSGNHKMIKKWRLMMSLRNTYLRRPELLLTKELSSIESDLLDIVKKESV